MDLLETVKFPGTSVVVKSNSRITKAGEKIFQVIDVTSPILNSAKYWGMIAALNLVNITQEVRGMPIAISPLLMTPLFPKSPNNSTSYTLFPEEELLKGIKSPFSSYTPNIGQVIKLYAGDWILVLSATVQSEQNYLYTPKPGDSIILSNPLGTNITVLGYRLGLISESILNDMLDFILITPIEIYSKLPTEVYVKAILEEGLLGSLSSLLNYNLGVKIHFEKIDFYPLIKKLCMWGVVPLKPKTVYSEIKNYLEVASTVKYYQVTCLMAPETAGPIAIITPNPEKVTNILSSHKVMPKVIGEVIDKPKIIIE